MQAMGHTEGTVAAHCTQDAWSTRTGSGGRGSEAFDERQIWTNWQKAGDSKLQGLSEHHGRNAALKWMVNTNMNNEINGEVKTKRLFY